MASNVQQGQQENNIEQPTQTSPNPKDVLQSINPKSFFSMKTVDIKYFNLTAPFPVNLSYEQLITKFSENYMEGYVIKDKEGVFSTNKDIVKK